MITSILLTLVLFLTFPQVTKAESTPSFSFSDSNLTVNLDDTVTIPINLNTADHQVTGADLVLEFDSTSLDISQIDFDSPLIFPYNFFITNTQTNPSQAILKTTSSFVKSHQTFTGSGRYATLHLTGKKLGTSTIKFVCHQDNTTDTNLAESLTGRDLIECANLTNLTVTVSATANENKTQQDTSIIKDSSNQPSSNTSNCPLPDAPTNLQAFAIDLDTILLTWNKASKASNYSLLFGTSPAIFQFGTAGFGDTDQLLINYLAPNTTYYFALNSINDCGSSSHVYTSGRTLTPKPGSEYTAISSRYPPVSPTPKSNLAKLPATPDPNAIYEPEVPLSETELEAIPSLDNILEVNNQSSPSNNSKSSDESPTTTKPNPQLALILISFIIILPTITFFILRKRNSDIIHN